MIPQAAKELVECIMLDEFVARRAALRSWELRWCVTADFMIEVKNYKDDKEVQKAVFDGMSRAVNSILRKEVPVLDAQLVGDDSSGKQFVKLVMHFLRTEPRHES